uniref:Damage-control phosphatase ARMT1-like metal-binding domain-containing protein n=1 Tax=Candidatus Kentrum sp. UNK TaxID=2126344 RepID=A0A451B2E2_9GAMM|nr:MAG: hypothetical protein BECKUNK1418G_GA0071005_11211 [Candidatus Kentron sp. UNK]VFK72437.1 MAG: hypothetical protein BECKUNK1418H_GA0071006_11151 [Candidatus Kentron sp. UNK]
MLCRSEAILASVFPQMKNHPECYPCLLKLAVEMGKIATDDEEIHWKIVQETLERIGIVRKDRIPIAVGKEIQAIVRRLADNPDPYRDIKKEYNRKARELLPLLEAEIERSDNRFLTALKIIATANIIDVMMFASDRFQFAEFLQARLSSDFKGDIEPAALIAAIGNANSILYVADNCGEIILDCYFIDRFLTDKKVYLSVRGGPALNDATKEDLDGISFHGRVQVMDTGDDSPGVILATSSDTFNKIYNTVDLVILKGQGNFEGIGVPERDDVYSLFIAKCPMISRHAGCEMNDLVLMRPR